ncbi:MAG TPA: multidrug ABC transporter ATP-binding protein [Candidatus Cloacimonas sp.]|jgi:ATP-binding cassette subfamily B protein|nr:ATP-binding cassette, subfamily multidrug efflux pump [Candidatus Cloacimonadota bacterium]HCX72259.1 multidrug ABC transporter ATP-binding protein [Candidatus Cloacimonas sp.]
MKETFKRLIPFLKKNLHKILFGIFLIILVDVAQLTIPKVMQITIDKIGARAIDKTGILHISLFLVGLSLVIAGIRYLWRILLIGTSWEIDRDIRQMYYEHLMRLSRNFYNKSHTGDLMAYATNDLRAVRMLIGFGFVVAVDIIFLSISTIFFMVSYNLKLTLMAVAPLPLLSIIIMVFGKKIHFYFSKVQKHFATLSGKVQESISGIRVVKSFVQEEAELEKMSKSAYDYLIENINLVKISQGIFHPFMFLVINLSMMIVLVFGGEYAIVGEISMGAFIAFFQYLGMLVWPMIAVGQIVNMYQRGTASLKRINSIFDVEPEIVDESPDENIKELKGDISVRNLSFRYKEGAPLIFDNISFDLEAGKTLALVGRTGSGKSTLIDLLTRVYNPPRNTIYIDGHEIYNISLENLRHNIVMVPQDIFLFSDSIAGNVSLGRPDATRKEIESIAQKAQVYCDIIQFENGFDTIIGERGVTLSGGQKQRLAISRALLSDPNILILDDALSAVDTKTEKDILDTLIETRKNKTTIIIAHRISSLQHADKIIVLDNAKIAEMGTHEELLAINGIYRDIYEKQQLEEKLEK